MTNEQIVEAAKSAEMKTEFGELVHSKVSRGVNSAYGIGFLEGAEWARGQLKPSRFHPGDWVVYDGPLGHGIFQVKDVVDGRYTFVDNDSTLLEEDSDKFLRPLTPKDVEGKQKPSAEDVLTKAGLKPYMDGNQWCILARDNLQEGICGFGDTIEDALYEFLMDVLKTQQEQKPLTTEETELNSIAFLEQMGYTCIPPRKEQNPAEWSKEDEEMLTELLLTIEPSDNYDEMRNWLLLKLKSLLLQGSKDSLQTHWKPSENIDIYEVAYERYPINNRLVREVTKDINEDTRDGFIDGYKYCDSTRWKPSEEQMSMLLAVINDPNNAGAESCYMALKSIYNNLKKL